MYSEAADTGSKNGFKDADENDDDAEAGEAARWDTANMGDVIGLDEGRV